MVQIKCKGDDEGGKTERKHKKEKGRKERREEKRYLQHQKRKCVCCVWCVIAHFVTLDLLRTHRREEIQCMCGPICGKFMTFSRLGSLKRFFVRKDFWSGVQMAHGWWDY